jgi:hypothetical protein
MYKASSWLSTRTPLRPRRVVGPFALLALTVCALALPAAPAAASPQPAIALPAEVSGLSSSKVQELLAGIPLNDLSATQLSEALSQLPGLSTLPVGQLQGALTQAIEQLQGKGDALGQLGNTAELVSKVETVLKTLLSPSQLLSLLKGENLTTLLSGALGSSEPSQLIDKLLQLNSANPVQLVEEILADVNPAKLQALLGGTTLTGESPTKSTVGELASKLGTTVGDLASSVGVTAEELPAAATALTANLTNGKTLGILDGLTELSLGVVVPAKESGSGGSGGTGGSGGSSGSAGSSGSGGSGGTSGNGTSGAPGSTTLIVESPAAQSTGAASPAAKATKATVKVISHKVRGNDVTVVVQVSGAGKLTLAGKGVRSVSKQTSTAERVTLRTVLTKAGVASRKRRRDLKVELNASFKAISGSSAASTATVVFG